jgi:hypothetical protein
MTLSNKVHTVFGLLKIHLLATPMLITQYHIKMATAADMKHTPLVGNKVCHVVR